MKLWTMLERREEYGTYLTHICRHCCSRKNPVRRQNIRSFQPTLWLVKATVLAESSLYFVFSLSFFRSSNVHRRVSRCCTLSMFYFILQCFQIYVIVNCPYWMYIFIHFLLECFEIYGYTNLSIFLIYKEGFLRR